MESLPNVGAALPVGTVRQSPRVLDFSRYGRGKVISADESGIVSDPVYDGRAGAVAVWIDRSRDDRILVHGARHRLGRGVAAGAAKQCATRAARHGRGGDPRLCLRPARAAFRAAVARAAAPALEGS